MRGRQRLNRPPFEHKVRQQCCDREIQSTDATAVSSTPPGFVLTSVEFGVEDDPAIWSSTGPQSYVEMCAGIVAIFPRCGGLFDS